MASDFTKYTNYKDDAGISGVVFGAKSAILEVELNEMQEIQNTMSRRMLGEILGDGISDITKIVYENSVFKVNGDCIILAGGHIIKCTGLSIFAGVSVNADVNIYLQVWEEVVDYNSTLKKEGNQQSTITVENYIKDPRATNETSRRKVVKYTLTTSQDVNRYNLLIGTIHSNGEVTKAIKEVNYGRLYDKIIDIQIQLGTLGDGVIGVEVDLDNNTIKRVGDNEFWNPGSDYTKGSSIYRDRSRCAVNEDGTIYGFYSMDSNDYDGIPNSFPNEDTGTCQFMVYQPAFYYKRVPIRLVRQNSGNGYNMTRWIDLISPTPRHGFKLHPAFMVGDTENHYYLIGENNGSICWKRSGSELSDLLFEYDTEDAGSAPMSDYPDAVFSSIPSAKPASGKNMALTTQKMRDMCMSRGSGWCTEDITIASAEQMLFLIEYATFNAQNNTILGTGLVALPYNTIHVGKNNSVNNPINTSLGDNSGVIPTSFIDGTGTTRNENTPVFRGVKNPYGNINTFVDGIILKGIEFYWSNNGVLNDNVTLYESCGFICNNGSGFASAFGHSDKCDFMYLPTLVDGDSIKPVGDIFDNSKYVRAENNFIAIGGNIHSYDNAGIFCTSAYSNSYINGSIGSHVDIGCRLCYKNGR